ncbi:carboxypeptidase-like regulatory domain-containing protein [Hymenobacter elongatus]|uniref:Carboxypeptidase-like regulatory domain-containing protein n=1 Tax=Hymenobacter elongatus TaxID=877208 RepID=A0A4Z0PJH1_9BACT|nr:carboxypeptidase-like regulatory domain-containing protein [Hymenobacter elongatus]TGE15704.1 hypothetical protein E5J99_12025 [Hymenobacter elongatus]
MALSTQSLQLLPLLLAVTVASTQAQSTTVALLRPAQQPEPFVRNAAQGTSLESILQEFKTVHHAFIPCRSDLIKDKFVNVEALTFRTREDELTYVVTVSGLRVEKTGRNVYIISKPKTTSISLQTIVAGEGPAGTGAEKAEAATQAPVPVRGQTTGTDNAPIPGATVVVKGTTNGTATDTGGNFSLSLPDANATLVISAIGFVTQETHSAHCAAPNRRESAGGSSGAGLYQPEKSRPAR